MENQPRFTLHPAHCADGISKSGAGFRVVHTDSGKQIGVVAQVGDGWVYIHPSDVILTDEMLHYSSPQVAATALGAHDLDLNLARVLHRTLTAGADDVAEMAARIPPTRDGFFACPMCGRVGQWTDGTSTAPGDERDEYWCQTCGAEVPLEACTPQPAPCSC